MAEGEKQENGCLHGNHYAGNAGILPEVGENAIRGRVASLRT